MIKKLKYISIFTLLMLSLPAQAMISVVDDSGRKVKIISSAKRIISLAPHITESLFSAGAGKKIIGAVSYSDYPEEAKKIPRIGGYPTLDIEKIISLNPDLVIAWSSGNNTKQVDKLISLGITVFMSNPHTPIDIANTIKRFGILAGTTKVALKSYTDFMLVYSSLKDTFSDKKEVKVFYQIWNKPLITINGKHLISDIIQLCGGSNIFKNLYSLTPKVSLESVIATGVEAILLGAQEHKKPQWASQWAAWSKFSGIKEKKIYFINPDLLNRAGPRILLGAEQMCKILDEVRSDSTTLN